jgi:hypothetical protein
MMEREESTKTSRAPRAAVLGSTLSSSERIAARNALGRLDIQCAERRTQEDVSPDESVFIVVGNDLAAAERLAKRCRSQRRPAHRPLWTELTAAVASLVAGGRALWGSTCSTPSLRSGTCCGSRYALSRQSIGFRSKRVLYAYREALCNQHCDSDCDSGPESQSAILGQNRNDCDSGPQ